MAEVIRRAVDGYLDEQADPRAALAATFGVGSGSSRCHLATSGIVADFLIDTDVFIDHLRGAKELEPKSHRVHYSVVTRAELSAGNAATEIVRVLLAPFREIDIDREIAERAGRLRRESGIGLPDALIAATAKEHKLSLYARSRSGVDGVRGLRIREIG